MRYVVLRYLLQCFLLFLSVVHIAYIWSSVGSIDISLAVLVVDRVAIYGLACIVVGSLWRDDPYHVRIKGGPLVYVFIFVPFLFTFPALVRFFDTLGDGGP